MYGLRCLRGIILGNDDAHPPSVVCLRKQKDSCEFLASRDDRAAAFGCADFPGSAFRTELRIMPFRDARPASAADNHVRSNANVPMARTPVPSGRSQGRSVLDASMMKKRVLVHEVSLIQTCLQLTMIIAGAGWTNIPAGRIAS